MEIKFHRVAAGSVPEGGWKQGHVYFVYNSDDTGEIKIATETTTSTSYVPQSFSYVIKK